MKRRRQNTVDERGDHERRGRENFVIVLIEEVFLFSLIRFVKA